MRPYLCDSTENVIAYNREHIMVVKTENSILLVRFYATTSLLLTRVKYFFGYLCSGFCRCYF